MSVAELRNKSTIHNRNLPGAASPGVNPERSIPQPSGAGEEVAALADIMLQSIQSLATAMFALRQDFDARFKSDESKQQLIDSLHQELQAYRDGLHFRILRPILLDLISIYDELGALIENASAEAPAVPRQVIDNLSALQESVEETLYRNGVEFFTVEQETFLPSRQRNLRVIPTADRQKDKQIARRVRKGFAYEGTLLRPEVVESFKFTPASASTQTGVVRLTSSE
jgi:molecular chaperone GrpE